MFTDVEGWNTEKERSSILIASPYECDRAIQNRMSSELQNNMVTVMRIFAESINMKREGCDAHLIH